MVSLVALEDLHTDLQPAGRLTCKATASYLECADGIVVGGIEAAGGIYPTVHRTGLLMSLMYGCLARNSFGPTRPILRAPYPRYVQATRSRPRRSS